MIVVNCQHCNKQHIVYPDEIANLIRQGKTVIPDCKRKRVFELEEEKFIFTNNISKA